MNLRKLLTGFTTKYKVLLICLMAPALLLGQKKTTTSAPAPRAAAPAPRPQPQVSRPQVARPTNNMPQNRTTTNTRTYQPNNRVGTGNNNAGTNRNIYRPGNATGNGTNNNSRATNSRTYQPNNRTVGGNNNGAGNRPGTTVNGRPANGNMNGARVPNQPGPSRASTFNRPENRIRTEHRTIGGRPADVAYRGNRISHIHTNGMDIHRGIRGDRRIERSDGRGGRVVAYGHSRGFYERAYFNRGSHRYIQRTYVWGGHRYAYAYRTYYWGGRPYYRYAPAFYYRPAFYGWAYRPWGRPVIFAWGWGAAPWYGYYGYYFAPAPFYPGPSLWVTDYLLAENLRLSYEAQLQDGGQPGPDPGPAQAGGQVVLTPEVKQAIADEVQAQLQAQQQAASAPGGPSAAPTDGDNQLPPALSPTQRTFVVGAALDVTAADGSECKLSPGDVLYRTSDPLNNGDSVNVLVQASQKGDCAMASTALVQIADLQEMHNQFCEQVDAALQKLATEQGKAGMPAAPDTGTVAGEVPPPAPDNNVDNQVQSAQSDADQVEKQASAPGGTN
jgi:hypothetical protein